MKFGSSASWATLARIAVLVVVAGASGVAAAGEKPKDAYARLTAAEWRTMDVPRRDQTVRASIRALLDGWVYGQAATFTAASNAIMSEKIAGHVEPDSVTIVMRKMATPMPTFSKPIDAYRLRIDALYNENPARTDGPAMMLLCLADKPVVSCKI